MDFIDGFVYGFTSIMTLENIGFFVGLLVAMSTIGVVFLAVCYFIMILIMEH